MDNLQFSPSSLTIKPCEKVTWLHQDGQAPHTVTSGMSSDGMIERLALDHEEIDEHWAKLNEVLRAR